MSSSNSSEDISRASANDDDVLNSEFVGWCEENHIVRFPGLIVSYVPSGWRGVITKQSIAKDECIVRVPQSLLLSTESARKDPSLMKAVMQELPTVTPVQLLGAHLLHEISKGSVSYWYHYLRTLPQCYTTGISLTKEEIQNLQVPYAICKVFSARQQAIESWKCVKPILNALHLPPKLKSWNAWRWAMSTISSRTMWLSHCTAGCLTPWGDLFNHASPPPPISPMVFEYGRIDTPNNANQPIDAIGGDGSLDEATGEYKLYARQPYQPEQEVYLCYGRHANLDLLQHYGFTLSGANIENPHDIALLNAAEVFPKEVISQLTSFGTTEAALMANGTPSWELLRALRLAALSSAERRVYAYRVLDDRPVSAKAESLALRILRDGCLAALRKAELCTTAEEDEALLSSNGLSDGMRVVILWRLGYKRIVLKTARRAAEAIQYLEGCPPDVDS